MPCSLPIWFPAVFHQVMADGNRRDTIFDDDGAAAIVASSVGTTAGRAGHHVDAAVFEELLAEAWRRGNNRAVRLLGVGVRFEDPKEIEQMEFFG